MKKTEAINLTRQRCRERNYRYETEKTYIGWIGRFCDFMLSQPGAGPQGFLDDLAPKVS